MNRESDYSSFRCFWTLLKKEILRFLAVWGQTVVAPLITASLYLLVFGVSLGQKLTLLGGMSYLQFIVPGLILMGVINNSFSNTSSSLFVSKYLGNIADLFVTPITPFQMIAAYTLAAVIRGILVGGIILLVSLLFTPLPWVHPDRAVVMILLSSFLFAQFGLIAALYARSFDTLAMFTNFLILPLVYLGGLFFPVSELPSPWGKIAQINPLYYLMNGFRSAVIGVEESPFVTSLTVTLLLSIVMSFWAAWLIRHARSFRV